MCLVALLVPREAVQLVPAADSAYEVRDAANGLLLQNAAASWTLLRTAVRCRGSQVHSDQANAMNPSPVSYFDVSSFQFASKQLRKNTRAAQNAVQGGGSIFTE